MGSKQSRKQPESLVAFEKKTKESFWFIERFVLQKYLCFTTDNDSASEGNIECAPNMCQEQPDIQKIRCRGTFRPCFVEEIQKGMEPEKKKAFKSKSCQS